MNSVSHRIWRVRMRDPTDRAHATPQTGRRPPYPLENRAPLAKVRHAGRRSRAGTSRRQDELTWACMHRRAALPRHHTRLPVWQCRGRPLLRRQSDERPLQGSVATRPGPCGYRSRKPARLFGAADGAASSSQALTVALTRCRLSSLVQLEAMRPNTSRWRCGTRQAGQSRSSRRPFASTTSL